MYAAHRRLPFQSGLENCSEEGPRLAPPFVDQGRFAPGQTCSIRTPSARCRTNERLSSHRNSGNSQWVESSFLAGSANRFKFTYSCVVPIHRTNSHRPGGKHPPKLSLKLPTCARHAAKQVQAERPELRKGMAREMRLG